MNIEQEEWEEEQAIEGIYTDMWDTMWGREPKDPRQRAELKKRAREKYYRMKEEEDFRCEYFHKTGFPYVNDKNELVYVIKESE